MKTGESVKGIDLVLNARDLLVMEGTDPAVHMVCDGRICRPDSSEGSPDRGDAYWTKVGSSDRMKTMQPMRPGSTSKSAASA